MIYIKFASVTLAEKAKNLLLSRSIKSYIKKNPNPNHKEGCNYALFVYGDISTAFRIIEKNSVSNLGIESFGEKP
ncbi:MAG: hypothetical protein IJ262_07195 [Clostridia bacterium]|nr:hypothetical protein [Clostridia bacterium]